MATTVAGIAGSVREMEGGRKGGMGGRKKGWEESDDVGICGNGKGGAGADDGGGQGGKSVAERSGEVDHGGGDWI